MNKSEMIRYSRINGRVPKNTLYTFRSDNDLQPMIYFGISRCDMKEDTFERSRGTAIAKQRAETVKKDLANQSTSEYNIHDNGILIHKSGLRGLVSINEVGYLLKYFKNVDDILIRSQP